MRTRRDGARRQEGRKDDDGEADKVQAKVQGRLSRRPFITSTSRRTLKGRTEKKKEKRNKKKEREEKKSNYIQLISDQSHNKTNSVLKGRRCFTKASNQPQRKKRQTDALLSSGKSAQ